MTRQYLTILLFILPCLLKGQDPFFSDPISANGYYNPSLIGKYEGTYLASISYRSQWFSFDNSPGFTTLRASFDYRLPSYGKDIWSLGLNILNDEFLGDRFRSNAIQLGASYAMLLSQKFNAKEGDYLRFGAQIGIAQSSIGWSELWFGRQYDLNSFIVDFDADTGEPNYNAGRSQSNFYPDINIGISYDFWASRDLNILVMLSARHLNQPKFDYNSVGNNILDRYFAFYSNAEYYINASTSAVLIYHNAFQSSFQQHSLGGGVNLINDDAQKFGFTLAGRLNKGVNGIEMDALVIGSKLNFNQFTLGLTYDVYLSEISKGERSLSAFEFHLSFRGLSFN